MNYFNNKVLKRSKRAVNVNGKRYGDITSEAEDEAVVAETAS